MKKRLMQNEVKVNEVNNGVNNEVDGDELNPNDMKTILNKDELLVLIYKITKENEILTAQIEDLKLWTMFEMRKLDLIINQFKKHLRVINCVVKGCRSCVIIHNSGTPASIIQYLGCETMRFCENCSVYECPEHNYRCGCKSNQMKK